MRFPWLLCIVTTLLSVGPLPIGLARPARRTKEGAGVQTYRAQWNMSRRRHGVGHRVATGRFARATVVLRLLPGGQARVSDRGERGHSSMGRLGYTGEKTRWTTSWRGTWTRKGATVRLRLRLVKRQCTRSKTDRHHTSPTGVTTRHSCGPDRKRMTLLCTRVTIRARPRMGGGATTSRNHPAWRCLVTGNDMRTNGMSHPWVFGIQHSLKTISGWPLRYELGARRTP